MTTTIAKLLPMLTQIFAPFHPVHCIQRASLVVCTTQERALCSVAVYQRFDYSKKPAAELEPLIIFNAWYCGDGKGIK